MSSNINGSAAPPTTGSCIITISGRTIESQRSNAATFRILFAAFCILTEANLIETPHRIRISYFANKLVEQKRVSRERLAA